MSFTARLRTCASWAAVSATRAVRTLLNRLRPVPVILGPSTYNFAQIAADALRMGAAFAVKDAREGITRALELVDNAALRSLASQRALTFAKTYTGAVGKMADKAEELWKKSA